MSLPESAIKRANRKARQIDRIHDYILHDDAKHIQRAARIRDRLYSQMGRDFWTWEAYWNV